MLKLPRQSDASML